MAINKKKTNDGEEMGLSRKRSRKISWLVTGIFTFLLLIMCLGALKETSTTLADSHVYNSNEITDSTAPNEITGSSNEAVKKLQGIINSDNQTFIYYYEPNCELCSKLEPTMFSIAEGKGITLHRFNLKKYNKALDLKNEKGMPLVKFYKKLPVVAYYNKGWLIAWAEGNQSDKTYEEFYDHFRFGDDDGHK